MMQEVALQILRNIAANIHDSVFFSMCHEATDAGNVSQLVVCLRWVDNGLTTNDEFIGLKDMSSTGARIEGRFVAHCI